ncbi:MAG TPA: hypothetical protein DD416_05725, partial [Rhodobacteraceae bacterium]|nr:hypothetical protein [Paracoccaceae bacterium]
MRAPLVVISAVTISVHHHPHVAKYGNVRTHGLPIPNAADLNHKRTFKHGSAPHITVNTPRGQ